jgi:SAM-dependent methyltransferase
MPHRVTGLHAVFSIPSVYEHFQQWIGADAIYRTFVRHLDIRPGQRVLDLGCGTGTILQYLPDVDYTGIDLSEEYIRKARSRYPGRGTFHCRRFDESFFIEEQPFDRILAVGLLHHLDDTAAAHVFALGRAMLKPDGLLGTIDPCYTPDQSAMARLLIRQDRGEAVRTVEGYERLALGSFDAVRLTVCDKLLRIPYTHLVMTCGAPARLPAEGDARSPAATSTGR